MRIFVTGADGFKVVTDEKRVRSKKSEVLDC